MKLFKVIVHRKVFKELSGLSPETKKRITEALKEMETNPFTGDIRPVKGLKGVFRRRVGDYGIFFTVLFEENNVVILYISHISRA